MGTLSEARRAEIAAEVAALRERVLSPQPVHKPVENPVPRPQRGPGRGANLRDRAPRLSREKVLELHRQGMRVSEISENLGVHRSTVSRALNELGVPMSERKGGPVRRSTCARGHDMDVHGRELSKGGRYCSECQRIRQRT